MILHETSGKQVYLVIYTHKHGVDHAVCATEGEERGHSGRPDRHEDDHPHLKELAQTQPEDGTPEDYMKADQAFVSAYNEVEMDICYGENIEVEVKDLVTS